MIPDYVDSLTRALSFDPSLSRRIRQEVEDHLWEAVAADPAGDRLAAERRAIANFGDAQVIAAEFAVVSLVKQTMRTGVAVVVAIAAVFIAMKARVAWYAVSGWTIGEDIRPLSGIIASIDYYAFWLAVVVGIAGWAYIGSRPFPATFGSAHRRQIRRCIFICIAAAGALIASVASDGALTVLRLMETEMSARFLIPVVSMAIEIACAGVLICYLLGIRQRTASTAALLKAG